MNKLFGILYWNRRNKQLRLQNDNSFAGDSLELYAERIHNFSFDSANFYYHKKGNILCAVIGYISNLAEIKLKYQVDCTNDTEIIAILYMQLKLEFVKDLDGVFSIFIFDENNQTGIIFQDAYGAGLPVYHTTTKNEFLFGSSLKQILINLDCNRELDLKAVSNFLYHRTIIPNKFTLIKNIKKLIPEKYILIDLKNRQVKIKHLKGNKERITKEYAKTNLLKSIENNIKSILGMLNKKNIVQTLSSGFDTNLVLSILTKHTKKQLDAITIGGKTRNEISQTKRIVSNYSNINHIIKIVSDNCINSYPDIVWRTEGYVFEAGLFLQYEISNILNSGNHKFVFLGDCADQQLDFYRLSIYRKIKNRIKKFIIASPIANFYYMSIKRIIPEKSKTAILLSCFRRFPRRIYYDIDFDFIVKKSSIMLNSFGIQGLYPFVGTRIKTISKRLGRLNADKAFYKEKVKERLGKQLANLLEKQPGDTDIEYVLNANRKQIMKIFDSSLLKNILSKSNINKISKNPEYYPRLILQLLYLYLFNKLFISGKYDSSLNESGLKKTLTDFI